MNSDCTIAAQPLLQRGLALGWDGRALLAWSVKSGIAVFDQGIISGSNLLLNVLLARWLAGPEYGGFAVAFTAFLFLSGFHNSVVLEPMTVLGPADYSDRPHAYFRAQLKIHFALCGILTLVAIAIAATAYHLHADRALWSAILGCGIATPFVLMLWLTRRHWYCGQRPSRALLSSALYSACVLGGAMLLFRVGRLSSLTAFLLMAFASMVGAGVSLVQGGLLASETKVAAAAAVLRENWCYGRWLVGFTVLYSLATQVQTLVAAAVLGLTSAGVMRAATVPMLAMVQGITAVTTLALPAFSADFARGALQNLRKKGTLLTLTLTAVVAVCEVFLFAFSGPAEKLLYHGRFSSQAWLIPIIGLVALFTAASGYSVVLRSIQRPESSLIVAAIAAPIGIVSALFFTQWWGVAGAAFSTVLAAAIGPVVYMALYKKWFPRRSTACIAPSALLSPVRTNGAH